MSEYWHDEDYQYEPEPQLEIPEGAGELKIKLSINAGQIEAAVQSQLNQVFEDRLKKMIQKKISEAMKDLLSKDSWSDRNFKEILLTAVKRRLDEKYPEVTENKVNEFYEYLKNLKYQEGRSDAYEDIKQKAHKKVEAYINTELAESVKMSKEYIEQFAKNYFANNLFRAMGMMDKMIPHTENAKIQGNDGGAL